MHNKVETVFCFGNTDLRNQTPDLRKAQPGGLLTFKKKNVSEPSAVDGAVLWDSIEKLESGSTLYKVGSGKGPVVFCIHGAGHSAMVFTLLGQEVKSFATLVSYDLEGHGSSWESAKSKPNLEIEALVGEAARVFEAVSARHPGSPILLLGHSLGACIAARLAKSLCENGTSGSRIAGVVLVDMMEGLATESIQYMTDLLKARPASFESFERAIKWSINSKSLFNVESARISIPHQLTPVSPHNWKVDLLTYTNLFPQWFKSFNATFLALPVQKVLLMSKVDVLDTDIRLAQLQSKLKIVTFPHVGHCIMEDDPKNTARTIKNMLDVYQMLHATNQLPL